MVEEVEVWTPFFTIIIINLSTTIRWFGRRRGMPTMVVIWGAIKVGPLYHPNHSTESVAVCSENVINTIIVIITIVITIIIAIITIVITIISFQIQACRFSLYHFRV